MESGAVVIDNQPVAASFFNEGRWLTDFVTPEEPDIELLYREITKGLSSTVDKITACWEWVANQIKYKSFISAKINIEGRASSQDDYWQTPSMCARTTIGNCANKAFLLTSLVRNILSQDQAYCVLGNLYNGHQTGHAWCEISLQGKDYILESTRGDVPMIEAKAGDRYEPVHYFNDAVVLAMPGRTVMTPFSACYSDWLRDYIQWSYVNRI